MCTIHSLSEVSLVSTFIMKTPQQSFPKWLLGSRMLTAFGIAYDPMKQMSLKLALKVFPSKIVEITKFNLGEASIVTHVFWKYSDGHMRITTTDLRRFFTSTFCIINRYQSLIRGYERLRTPYVYTEEFAKILSTMMLGTIEEQASHVFEVYDINGLGSISRDELMLFLNDAFDTGKMNFSAYEKPVTDIVDYLLKKMSNERGDINRQSFVNCIKKNPLLMECCIKVWPLTTMLEAFKHLILENPSSIKSKRKRSTKYLRKGFHRNYSTS